MVFYMNNYYDANALFEAGTKSIKGSRWKYSTLLFEMNQLLETAKLQKALMEGKYRPAVGSKFVIKERGKTRYISSATMQDKTVNHIVCDKVLTPYLHKYLQYDNSASQKGKGVSFHRQRFETHLHQYFNETGSNEGYILLWDYSGYYANIPHEKCLATVGAFLDLELIDPLERQLTKEIMAATFRTFEMDVSRFSDKEVAEMYRRKVDPLLNAGVPAAQLTGEKWLRKGVDIGNQQSQDIGILYPYRIDNFCKIVCGFRHFGRYTDDSYIIHRSKEKLLQAFEGIKKIAAEFGLIINERKTRICKLSDTYRHLQIQYSLTASGRLIRKINPKAVTRERRRLKAYKRLLDAGRMAYSKIEESFKSWIASVYKYMSRQQIQGLSRLFYDLFGKAPTWKKTHGSSHGRLRWMMALPSAA